MSTRKKIHQTHEPFSPQSMQTPAERQSLIEEAGHLWSRLSGGIPVDKVQDLRIGFVSTFAGEGSTSMAANFARFAARRGGRVAVVEANLRRPGLSREFNMPPCAGLWDLVERTAQFKEAAKRIEGVTLVCAGRPPHDFSNDFDYRNVQKVTEFLQRHHQLTVIDAPPLSSSPECGAILKSLDHVLLVVRANRTKKEDVERSLATLQELGVRCAGIVLNDVRYDLPSGLQKMI